MQMALKWWIRVLCLSLWSVCLQGGGHLECVCGACCQSVAQVGTEYNQPCLSLLRRTEHATQSGRGAFQVGYAVFMCSWSVICFVRCGSDGQRAFCDTKPPDSVLGFFNQRGDNQIMSLELLAIAYGQSVCLFAMGWKCASTFSYTQVSLLSVTCYAIAM